MRLKILKVKIVICAFIIALSMSNCTKNNNLEHQITIKINSIDTKTKQHRVNAFDIVEVRTQGIGYLMKTFDKVGEYVTDSTGSVNIKVDRTKENHFILRGTDVYGATEFDPEELKDGQEVNIEVVSLEKR